MNLTSTDLQRILDRRSPGIRNAHQQIAMAQRDWPNVRTVPEAQACQIAVQRATYTIRRIAELN